MLYGFVVDFKKEVSVAFSDPIHDVSGNLLEIFIQSLEVLGDINTISEESMYPMIDSFVNESIMDAKQEYLDRLNKFNTEFY